MIKAIIGEIERQLEAPEEESRGEGGEEERGAGGGGGGGGRRGGREDGRGKNCLVSYNVTIAANQQRLNHS